MRIIAGEYRSRVLKTLEGNNTRPTTDKVRGAIFSKINHKIINANVLDLFGGSGALSFEACSRGASNVVCNEKSLQAIKIIKENQKNLDCKNIEIIQGSFEDTCKSLEGQSFDIIFVDPPYEANYYTSVFTLLNEYKLVNKDGLIICESNPSEVFKEEYSTYKLEKEKKYGKCKVTYFRNEE